MLPINIELNLFPTMLPFKLYNFFTSDMQNAPGGMGQVLK